MTNADVVSAIAAETNLKKVDVTSVLESFKNIVLSTVKSDGDVSITGLGKFSLQVKKARTARNPKTGETVQVPENKTVKFKAASKTADSLA